MLAEDIRHPEKQPMSSKGGRKKYKDKKREKRGRDRAPSQEGSLKNREVSKHQETFSLPNLCRALEAQRATQKGRKINNPLTPADYEPYGNSLPQRRSSTDACTRHQQAGAGQGGMARAASLRVRIWPEYPERYLSEIIWASKPDCGISTTRKASPNLRHRQTHARNKGLNRDSRLQTIPLL